MYIHVYSIIYIINIGVLSGIHSGILSIFWHTFPHSIWYPIWNVLWHSFWDALVAGGGVSGWFSRNSLHNGMDIEVADCGSKMTEESKDRSEFCGTTWQNPSNPLEVGSFQSPAWCSDVGEPASSRTWCKESILRRSKLTKTHTLHTIYNKEQAWTNRFLATSHLQTKVEGNQIWSAMCLSYTN